MAAPGTIRRLTVADVTAYRAMRIERLVDSPTAFGGDLDHEMSRPQTDFSNVLTRDIVAGAFANGALVAIAALHVIPGVKRSHKALLYGVYVQPSERSRGVGRSLLTGLFAMVPVGVDYIRLSVNAANAAAIDFYISLGFERYGYDQAALRVDGVNHDELLMSRRIA